MPTKTPSIAMRWALTTAVISLLVLIPCVFGDSVAVSVQYPYVALLSGLLVLYASYNQDLILPMPSKYKSLDWIGTRSYVIYLIHVPLLRLNQELWYRCVESFHIIDADGFPYLTMRMVAFVLTLVVSAEVLHRTVEIPCTAFGRKLSSQLLTPSQTMKKAASRARYLADAFF